MTVYSFVLKMGDVFEKLSPNGKHVLYTRTVRACDGHTVLFEGEDTPTRTTIGILQDTRTWRRAQ